MITPRTDPLLWLALMITIACSALAARRAARYRYAGRHKVAAPPVVLELAVHEGGRLCLASVAAAWWEVDACGFR